MSEQNNYEPHDAMPTDPAPERAPVSRGETLDEAVEAAAAQLLIGLAFLVPTGTNLKAAIGGDLAAYKAAIEARAKAVAAADRPAPADGLVKAVQAFLDKWPAVESAVNGVIGLQAARGYAPSRWNCYTGQGWPVAAWFSWLRSHRYWHVRYFGVRIGDVFVGVMRFRRSRPEARAGQEILREGATCAGGDDHCDQREHQICDDGRDALMAYETLRETDDFVPCTPHHTWAPVAAGDYSLPADDEPSECGKVLFRDVKHMLQRPRKGSQPREFVGWERPGA